MNAVTRIVNILWLLLLTVVLLISTTLYFYQESAEFAAFLDDTASWLKPQINWLIFYSKAYQIEPRWGIAFVFTMVLLYLVIGLSRNHTRLRPPSPSALFLINLAIVLGAGIIATIYYWPEDTIRFGNFFRLQRGPREKFLEILIHIGIFVVVLHLFLFLVFTLSRWIFWGSRPKIVKSRETSQPPEEKPTA